MRARLVTVGGAALVSITLAAQSPAPEADWSRAEGETLQHFQALLRLDTSAPPGYEKPAADYITQVLEREGVPVRTFALEPGRPNLVARIRGNGRKRPILLMGHTDVVGVDASKWKFAPFSAARDQGYIYGRGALDDRPHLVGGLMTMLMLKRLNLPLDRDVIFLAEAGEEGMTRIGIDFLVKNHYADIDAEYCFAEVGNIPRVNGRVQYAAIDALEKIPRPIELVAKGTSGHASIPLPANAVVRLARAVAAVGSWRTPIRLNETTREYFTRLATVSPADTAAKYRAVVGQDAAAAEEADRWLLEHEPHHSAMLRTSVAPTIVDGGSRFNVIPSEARATIDVRMLPDEDPAVFLREIGRVVNDPAVDVAYSTAIDLRPSGGAARLDSEAFEAIQAAVAKHYQTITVPRMLNGATDMAFVRARGMQCFGFGPAVDAEDAQKGFGPHSDQERVLESELHRFVRLQWDVVTALARAR